MEELKKKIIAILRDGSGTIEEKTSEILRTCFLSDFFNQEMLEASKDGFNNATEVLIAANNSVKELKIGLNEHEKIVKKSDEITLDEIVQKYSDFDTCGTC